MWIYVIIIAIFVGINPILGSVGVFFCLGIHILKDTIGGGKKKEDQKKNQTSDTEDEFDFWQDNQGL